MFTFEPAHIFLLISRPPVCSSALANVQLAKVKAERQEELWSLAVSGGRAFISQFTAQNRVTVPGADENGSDEDPESVIMDWVQVRRNTHLD